MPRPLNVILDLTARCNLKCVMCYFANTDRLFFQPFDKELSSDGNMPVEVFEKIAADLFPKAWRVALGCAAEPMIHPKFKEIVAIAGRYGIPDLWFPTNLLALTDATAESLIQARVNTVAASIDGMTKETYEKIRVPAKWERLLACLDTLRRVRTAKRSRTPRLRIIFTWMRSNRQDLQLLPEFAADHGASEIDVRFVSETPGVDVKPELLSDVDIEELNAELASARPRRGLARPQARVLSPVRVGPRRGGLPRAHAPPDLAPPRRARPARVLALLLVPGPLRLRLPGPQLRHPAQRRGQPVHLLGTGSDRVLPRRQPRADRRRRALEADPRRAAHGQAHRHLRDLRRAPHGPLPAPRHGRARDSVHRAPPHAPALRLTDPRRLGFLSSCAGRGIRPPAPFRAGRRGRSSPG